MKILSIYIGRRRGGCFKRLCLMLQAALDAGWEVHYVSTESPAHPGGAVLTGVHWHRVPGPFASDKLTWAVFLAAAIPFTLWLAFRLRPDAFVCFEQFGTVALPARWALGIPLLSLKRGDSHAFLDSRRASWVERAVFGTIERLGFTKADKVFTVSEDLARRVRADYELTGSIEVLRNNARAPASVAGLEREAARSALGVRPDAWLVVAAGTLKRSKGMEVVIDAASRLTDLPVELVILGDGPDREALTERASRAGFGARIRFPGWLEDIGTYLRAADAVVVPSIHDDCPNVLLEALASGCLCLASRAGGIPELLPDDDLLFGPGDAGDLAERLRRLATDPALARALAGKCRRQADQLDFDWGKRITGRLEATVRDLRAGRSRDSAG